MNISDVFNSYVSSVEASRATSTVDTYKYKLNTAKKNLEYEDTEKVTKEVAQAFIDNLSEKYATKTVRGIYDVVNAAFRFAVSNGSIKGNPFEGCHVNPVEYHVPVILSEEQAEELLKAANYNQSLYIPILIAILTGLRRSQVLALTWGDIDFSNATIKVDKNLLSAKYHVFTEGKEHQKRTIEMPDRLSKALLNLKNYRRSIGVDVGANDFICLTTSHGVLEPTYFDKLFRTFVKSCPGIPSNLRFHDLRWGYIKNQVLNNVDPMTIADSVGHKSCVFTMDYYYRYRKDAA